MENMKVTIIGLGLIGGSLARVLRERLKIRDITAVSRNQSSINEALSDGCIDRGFTRLDEQVFQSDLIFLCTPVSHVPDYIKAMYGKLKKSCILTDVGSTKGEIVSFVNSLDTPPCFVGGHPMAGTEKTGYRAGYSHLFENAYYILTPCKSSTSEALETMEEVIRRIGALPVVLDADEHDRITGAISHLPHIIASALVNLVSGMETPDSKMRLLAAGGFRDITRIASSSPEMWENIISSNSEKVLALLDSFENVLKDFKGLIKGRNCAGLLDFFEKARAYRNSLSTKQGLLLPAWELIVDVVDKPGIIGNIATLLGSNGINIKNINVSNSREFEQGCLRITLTDSESMETGYLLLSEAGYKAYKVS